MRAAASARATASGDQPAPRVSCSTARQLTATPREHGAIRQQTARGVLGCGCAPSAEPPGDRHGQRQGRDAKQDQRDRSEHPRPELARRRCPPSVGTADSRMSARALGHERRDAHRQRRQLVRLLAPCTDAVLLTRLSMRYVMAIPATGTSRPNASSAISRSSVLVLHEPAAGGHVVGLCEPPTTS